MPANQTQREFAIEVVRRLRDAGHEALWAGGCVRDELLGMEPKDFDVATSAHPEQVRTLFGHRRTLAIGASFGVISILGGKHLDPIEVATFRTDGAYLDGRHPAEVTFTTAEEDAQRRDFTMNGLFYDPLLEKLIDYVDGEQDLRNGVVRAIGDPRARFAEDKLRMLRAVRFATTFEFEIADSTLNSIQAMAEDVLVVSAERIGAELRKVLQHPQRSRGVELLRQSKLLAPLFPDLTKWVDQDPARWNELLTILQELQADSIAVALAACFCQGHNFEAVQKAGKSFRFTNKEIERAVWLVQHLREVQDAADLPWPRLQRVLVNDGAEALLALTTAMWGESHVGIQTCRSRLELPPEELNPRPIVTGDDLVAHGLKPGKHFGELLEFLRDAQLERQITSSQQALEMADQWVADHLPSD